MTLKQNTTHTEIYSAQSKTILCIDDEKPILDILSAFLHKKGYTVYTSTRGGDTVSLIEKHSPDAVFIDLKLPDINGFEILSILHDEYPELPAVVISGTAEMSDAIEAQRRGAWDYIMKPLTDLNMLITVLDTVLLRAELKKENREYRLYLKDQVVQRTAQLVEANERLKEMVIKTFNSIASIIEKRDPYTAGHQERVAILSSAIARQMHFSQHAIDGIYLAASVHDIGKISVPQEYLSKPAKLTQIEFELVKQHSKNSYEILKDIPSDWPIADMAHQHHERMNGSGYPNALKNEEILPGSYIIAVADVVEAISSHRPYRPALGLDAAIDEIKKGRGILYHPEAVDACLAILDIKNGNIEYCKIFKNEKLDNV